MCTDADTKLNSSVLVYRFTTLESLLTVQWCWKILRFSTSDSATICAISRSHGSSKVQIQPLNICPNTHCKVDKAAFAPIHIAKWTKLSEQPWPEEAGLMLFACCRSHYSYATSSIFGPATSSQATTCDLFINLKHQWCAQFIYTIKDSAKSGGFKMDIGSYIRCCHNGNIIYGLHIKAMLASSHQCCLL